MARLEQFLMSDLKIDGARQVRGAELVMQNHGVRIVDDAEALLPQSGAIIGVFIVGRLESFVEASEPPPGRARRQQECSGAIIHIAAEHVRGRKWIVAAPIAEA